MKFRGLRPPTGKDDVPRFVLTELVVFLNDLLHGLKRLKFGDNFESYETEVEILAGTDITIVHRLGFIPSRYIILRNLTGEPVGDFDTDSWTDVSAKLKNYGTSNTTIKVVFMR